MIIFDLSLQTWITTILVWIALIVYVLYAKHTTSFQRHAYMIIWLTLNVLWWTAILVYRVFFDYQGPSVVVTASRTIIDMQAYLSIIILFGFVLRPHKTRRRSHLANGQMD